MYHRMLGREDLIYEYGNHGVPRWERAGMPLMLPLMWKLMMRAVRTPTTRGARAGRARPRADEHRDEVAVPLRRGRRVLRRRAWRADLAFAALSAAVLVPEPGRRPRLYSGPATGAWAMACDP